MHNQYLEGTLQQTKSRKQNILGPNNPQNIFYTSTDVSENKSYIPLEKKNTQTKRIAISLQRLPLVFQITDNRTTLLTFSGVNTSAECIKKGPKNKYKTWSKTSVVQLAVWALPEQSDSTVNSETYTATNQWSTFSPPAQLACQNMQFTLSIKCP